MPYRFQGILRQQNVTDSVETPCLPPLFLLPQDIQHPDIGIYSFMQFHVFYSHYTYAVMYILFLW